MRRGSSSWARSCIGDVISRLGRTVVLALALVTLARGGVAAQSDPQAAKPRKNTDPQSAVVERRLTEAVRRDPGSFDARRALAAFYLSTGRIDAAIPHIERARTLDPTNDANNYDLARALIEVGRLSNAREHVKRMLSAKETGELHNLLGDVEERAGNLVGAAEEYQRAAHMDPTEEHLFDWGNNLIQLRAFEPATQVFAAAIARHPKSARLHVGMGIVQYSRGQYAEAVTSFCAAADLEPTDPRPYQFLGEMYGVAPELSAEITERLARFVETRPSNALAHFHYAMSLWKGQRVAPEPADMRRVEALLRRAVALDPQFANAYLQLGILLSEQKRYKEAIGALRTSTRLDHGLAQAHFRLAQAYQRTGQKALAAKEFEIFERLKGRSR
jgi:tetratricopeptide (TPR) repeat protein